MRYDGLLADLAAGPIPLPECHLISPFHDASVVSRAVSWQGHPLGLGFTNSFVRVIIITTSINSSLMSFFGLPLRASLLVHLSSLECRTYIFKLEANWAVYPVLTVECQSAVNQA